MGLPRFVRHGNGFPITQMLGTAGCPLLLKTVKVLGGCDCGGMGTLGVEGVLIRGIADRSVLTADFDRWDGLITCESKVFGQRAEQQPSMWSIAWDLLGSQQRVRSSRWWRWIRAERGKVRNIDQRTMKHDETKWLLINVQMFTQHVLGKSWALSHAHMCASGKRHTQRETQLRLTELRKMCVQPDVLSTLLAHPVNGDPCSASENA